MKFRLLELIYPTKCVVCKCLENHQAICLNCRKTLYYSAHNLPHTLAFDDKLITAYSLFYYSNANVKKIIFHMKKYRNLPLFKSVAEMLARKIQKNILNFSNFTIVHVPTRKQMVSLRGFDQSYLLSVQLTKNLMDKEYKPILKRVGKSSEQKLLSTLQRELNVKKKFQIRKNVTVPENIILVDDVLTTGSTAKECARTLMQNGAKNIFCVFVASSR